MKVEKISSLHDDLQTPRVTNDAGIGEYKDLTFARNKREEMSVITRLSQFGVDLNLLEEQGIKPHEIDSEMYRKLLAEAIRQKYDVIFGAVFDKYMLSGFGEKTAETERLKDVIKLADEYKRWGLNLIQSGGDIDKEGPNLVISLEGADFVTKIADLNKLMENGIQVYGLQYNKDNFLATNTDGLTELGFQAVRHLLMNNKVIDLAHSSRRTRQDILDLAIDLHKGHLIAYTHGSIVGDEPSEFKESMKSKERLLEENEAERIIKNGGIIGFGLTKPFFGSVEAMANRIDTMCQLDNGINHLAIGSDFGGVWNDLAIGISSVNEMDRLADELSTRFGMSDEKVNKILRNNAKSWVKKALI